MNAIRVAAALRALADAIETPEEATTPSEQPTATTEAPVKRGRGRPAKGEAVPNAAPAASPEPVVEADPFATAPAAGAPIRAVVGGVLGAAPTPAPTATLDEAREALKALSKATTQAQAVKVMKDSVGVSNLSEPLTPQQCAVLRDAAVKATPAAPVEAPDPFAGPSSTSITDPLPVAAAKALTIEEVKAVITKAGSKTAQDTLMKVVVKHGGVAKNAETGVMGASLKALPAAAYAAVVAEINALPNTKG